MKYTIKHALITCIGFAIFSMCLPWFTAATVLSINGFQIALALGNLLASMGNINSILSLASGLGSYLGRRIRLANWRSDQAVPDCIPPGSCLRSDLRQPVPVYLR